MGPQSFGGSCWLWPGLMASQVFDLFPGLRSLGFLLDLWVQPAEFLHSRTEHGVCDGLARILFKTSMVAGMAGLLVPRRRRSQWSVQFHEVWVLLPPLAQPFAPRGPIWRFLRHT